MPASASVGVKPADGAGLVVRRFRRLDQRVAVAVVEAFEPIEPMGIDGSDLLGARLERRRQLIDAATEQGPAL